VLEGVWEPASRCGTAFWEVVRGAVTRVQGKGRPGLVQCADEELPSADVIGGDNGLVDHKIEPAVACLCELRRLNIDSIEQTRSIQSCRELAVTFTECPSTTLVVGSKRQERVGRCAVVIQLAPLYPSTRNS
jgi:hypothetical protein